MRRIDRNNPPLVGPEVAPMGPWWGYRMAIVLLSAGLILIAIALIFPIGG